MIIGFLDSSSCVMQGVEYRGKYLVDVKYETVSFNRTNTSGRVSVNTLFMCSGMLCLPYSLHVCF